MIRPNLSSDPRDHVPPCHEPPAKPDVAALWIEITRRRLRGEWLEPEEEPEHVFGDDWR